MEDGVLVACERLCTIPVQHSRSGAAATSALIDPRWTGCGSADRFELIYLSVLMGALSSISRQLDLSMSFKRGLMIY